MLIETGSQNLSRLPGMAVYPAPGYSTQALQPVEAVAGRPAKPGRANNPLAPNDSVIYGPGGGAAASASVGSRINLTA